MVELINVSKSFKYHRKINTVIKEVNLKIEPGCLTTIAGKSGSGKTTLLNIISGLMSPTDGNVLYNNQMVHRYFDRSASRFRRDHLGFIFQHFNLIKYYTVMENVMIPLKFSSIPLKNHRGMAIELLNEVGIGDKWDYYPNLLSGGQMQRVAIARALINSPKLIIADEPTGNLDEKTSREIIDIFLKFNEIKKMGFLIVTHDQNIISQAPDNYRFENQLLKKVDKI